METTKNTRKLGPHQKNVLKIFGGIVKSNCDDGDGVEINSKSIYYGTQSELFRILYSLFNRDLIEYEGVYYRLTESGREVVKTLNR